MDFVLKNENGHVVACDYAGNFLFSADSWSEAAHEIEKLMNVEFDLVN